jgi:hypothetical protein
MDFAQPVVRVVDSPVDKLGPDVVGYTGQDGARVIQANCLAVAGPSLDDLVPADGCIRNYGR